MVVTIMGVSGSGKTAVGEVLAKRLDWSFEDADAWHSPSNIEKMRAGVALNDEDREPWIRSLREAIRGWIKEGRNVILACSALRKSYRDAFREGSSDQRLIQFVYLKGNFGEIHGRLDGRAHDFMPESLLKSQFETLEEPDLFEALAFEINSPVGAIVDSIVTSLGLGSSKEAEARQRRL